MTRQVIVAGALANLPFWGGAAWTRLSWINGLRRLDCDVLFVEQLQSARDEPQTTESVAYFGSVMRSSGLGDRCCLLDSAGGVLHGMGVGELSEFARDADLLVNITGHLGDGPIKNVVRVRAYVDLDPGYTQLWLAGGRQGMRLEHHDRYFTVGVNIATSGSGIPSSGIQWLPTVQPVVLDDWPASYDAALSCFTTVGSWRDPYGVLDYGGKRYGQKGHEFRRYAGLPGLTSLCFTAALDMARDDEADRRLLEDAGWSVVDPRRVAGTPEAFAQYVRSSGAEFSVAKSVYVETCSGWFSDRTVRYLASGKPALVHDTGFSSWLPTGLGVVPFRTVDEAVRGAALISNAYVDHAVAARRLAEEYFDSDRVLTQFLEAAGTPP
jgi:hypothetical protein